MNFDPIAELNVRSSQLKLEWLAKMDAESTGVFGAESVPLEKSPVAVVRVPDFFDANDSANERRRDLSQNEGQTDGVSTHNQSEAVTDRDSSRSTAPLTSHLKTGNKFPGTAAVARQIACGVTNQVSGIPIATPISSDLKEKPEDWLSSTKEKEKDERNKPDAASELQQVTSVATDNVDGKSIVELTNQILDRFPLAFPTVLLFAGSEWNPHVDETCAQVAYQLAGRKVGKVLLIDSDFEKSELTTATRMESQPGMAELFNRKMDLDGCIADHDEANMDFLPIGEEAVWHWRIAGDKIPAIVKEFKSRYQFVCVSVGNAHSEAAKIWAADAEGAFLVVSMAHSSQTVASSAVDQLHANGARLLGCIVSDAVLH